MSIGVGVGVVGGGFFEACKYVHVPTYSEKKRNAHAKREQSPDRRTAALFLFLFFCISLNQ
jgi:hypothetical protein